jgi:RHS repeat-associated protein
MGSLLEGQRDAGGQMYMRNRYYDPATGQFTQTDPIGIAGGLNTYGFAAGDPISYSDPYGLCPWWMLSMRGMCNWFNGHVARAAAGRGVGSARVRPVEIEYAQDNPLRAYTAFKVADRIFGIVKDLAEAGDIYGGVAGMEDGPADAIRHAAWSCHLAMLWGESEALIITGNHEDPEPASEEGKSKKEMDMANNAVGARIGARQRPRDGNCVRAAQDAYSRGDLRVNTLGPTQ